MPVEFIKELVENPHPTHKKNLGTWNFYLDSYEGGMDYTGATIENKVNTQTFMDAIKVFIGGKPIEESTLKGSNLFMHPKEKQADFLRRVQRSYYYNFCSPIIDIYTNHLFKQTIIEDFEKSTIKDTVEKRRDNIDRKGNSIAEFRKEVADFTQIYGHVFVLVDMPETKNEENMQQRIDNDQFPYFNIFMPQKMINWALDSFGKPYWILLCEPIDPNINPEENFDKKHKQDFNYLYWTRDMWARYSKDYNLINSKPHSLGEVPIVCIFDKPSKKQKNFLGISFIADIALIARDIYNLCSELTQIIRDQTFSFLAFQGNASDYNEMVLGTNRGVVYPEGMNVPQYVSPPPTNVEVIMKQIDNQISKIFNMAKLEAGSVKPTSQPAKVQSGVSKAWDFNQTNSALSKKAGHLEDGEQKLWELFAKWDNQKESKVIIDYPNEFSIQSLNEDLDEAEKLMKLNIGKMAKTEVLKALVQKKFPRLSKDKLKEIIDEVEKLPDSAFAPGVNGQAVGNRLSDRLGLNTRTPTGAAQ